MEPRRLAALLLAASLGACTEAPARPAVPAARPSPASPRTAPEGRIPPGDAVREPGRTVFLPHRAAPFDPAKENAVWCATFSMAWDVLGREVLKGAPLLGPPAPAGFVEGMNAHPFPLECLDPDACIVLAGTKADGVLDRIRDEGLRRFKKELPRRPIDLPDARSLLAYAYLEKNLPFRVPFEVFEEGMTFAGSAEPVQAFGLTQEGENHRIADIASQCSILFDEGKGEARTFGLRIETRDGKDELLLALVRPGATLEATWTATAARFQEQPRFFPETAKLGVPKVHFDLDHEFTEILGAPVLNPGFKESSIAGARQSVLFRMDETGLRLVSEGAMEAELCEVEDSDSFLFDRPFLVALREVGAKEPYLLLWIANTDLMPR